MLDKFKQMKELRDLQKSLESKEFSGESDGVTVVINGTFELKDIKLNSDLKTDQQEEAIKKAFSNAMQNAQNSLRNAMGGFGS
ncbi:MAG: YbaB/EbfC family nucleoid-associated protein [Candidatus Spechtbacterales bacterium]|nr:YbaB/EbfC family nucleoid-associated protein [Candidatus Spechtbacterales bacterium]